MELLIFIPGENNIYEVYEKRFNIDSIYGSTTRKQKFQRMKISLYQSLMEKLKYYNWRKWED